MSRLFNTLVVALLGCFVLLSGVVSAIPQAVEKRDLTEADVISAFRPGVFTRINVTLTVKHVSGSDSSSIERVYHPQLASLETNKVT